MSAAPWVLISTHSIVNGMTEIFIPFNTKTYKNIRFECNDLHVTAAVGVNVQLGTNGSTVVGTGSNYQWMFKRSNHLNTLNAGTSATSNLIPLTLGINARANQRPVTGHIQFNDIPNSINFDNISCQIEVSVQTDVPNGITSGAGHGWFTHGGKEINIIRINSTFGDGGIIRMYGRN